MSLAADSIFAHLKVVDAERARRSSSSDLSAKVISLKAFQQRRFSHTYSDLLLSPRYGAASRFFLDELYGPDDFTQRDAQFARVVPALVRVFPHEIVETVARLSELHALSESLDTAVSLQLNRSSLTPLDYLDAWQRAGREEDRDLQIALTLAVAEQLDHLTRKPLLRSTLRLMRRPARLAGLSQLQAFLESGFDTFQKMGGAQDFVAVVSAREMEFATALFAARPGDGRQNSTMTRALGCLPSE